MSCDDVMKSVFIFMHESFFHLVLINECSLGFTLTLNLTLKGSSLSMFILQKYYRCFYFNQQKDIWFSAIYNIIW